MIKENIKIAIIHDWLVNFGGAERVVLEILKVFPQADIFTLVYDKKKMSKFFPTEKIHTSFVQKIPFSTKIYTKLLNIMPKAFEEFDLSTYDLVIASSSSCAKGVIVPPTIPFIAYIHSPMRYAWDLYFDYQKKSGKITQFFMKKWIPQIRQWDFISSQRIGKITTNSKYVAKRIKRFWNRESTVIYPPVDTQRLEPNNKPSEDFYVAFSRFVPYKRIDLAISACGNLEKNLIVIGSGSQEKELKKIASKYFSNKSKITFTGRINDEQVKDYLQRCKALIFCAEEDFGIIPLEVQACGRPVIAFGKGGALETVIKDKTGVFFEEQTVESLEKSIIHFEELFASNSFSTKEIVENANNFSAQKFQENFLQIIENEMQNND